MRHSTWARLVDTRCPRATAQGARPARAACHLKPPGLWSVLSRALAPLSLWTERDGGRENSVGRCDCELGFSRWEGPRSRNRAAGQLLSTAWGCGRELRPGRAFSRVAPPGGPSPERPASPGCERARVGECAALAPASPRRGHSHFHRGS